MCWGVGRHNLLHAQLHVCMFEDTYICMDMCVTCVCV
jgi:hypothetical protein